MLETELQFSPSGDGFCGVMKSDWCYHSHQRQLANGKAVIPDNCRAEGRGQRGEQPSTAAEPYFGNLERFLMSTTPSVPSKHPSKAMMRGLRKCDAACFTLGDLWDSFKEWSAYGAAVPLVFNGGDCVVQYYVPYLSGIQLYTESAGMNGDSSMSEMQPREAVATAYSQHVLEQSDDESDDDCCVDSSSDGIGDSKLKGHFKSLREQFNCRHPEAEVICRMDRLSLRENGFANEEDYSNDDGELGNSQNHLLFEFLEQDLPCIRAPLADKVSDLSNHCPDLKTLRSCDLLPDSWMSVSWYPIYRIPTGPTLKDLDAHFLTFHSLSTLRKDTSNVPTSTVTRYDGIADSLVISLPALGLASYKFGGSTWTPGGCEKLAADTLLQSAGNWLRHLNVSHPDFRFFTSHSPRSWREAKGKGKFLTKPPAQFMSAQTRDTNA